MSPPAARLPATITGFPRVSGDEPAHDLDVDGLGWFSPRERG